MEIPRLVIEPAVSQLDALWLERIDIAPTTDAILVITRDFLATYTPEHFARLPAEWRPGHIKVDDDLEYWAYQLTKAYCAPRSERVDGALLLEILNFFLHAVIRLSAVRRREAVRRRDFPAARSASRPATTG